MRCSCTSTKRTRSAHAAQPWVSATWSSREIRSSGSGQNVETCGAVSASFLGTNRLLLSGVAGGGVNTVVLNRTPPFVPSYEPDSPFANTDGMVNSPNVNLDEELITTKMAENSYQANLMALKTSLRMQDTLQKALDTKS